MKSTQLQQALIRAAHNTPAHDPARRLMQDAAQAIEIAEAQNAALQKFIRNLLTRLGRDPAITDITAQAIALGVE
jgi:hypothetical protein